MVVLPSSQGRNLLVADWADTVLLLPKEEQLPPTFEGSCHGDAEACFKVGFPRRVVRIGRTFDFRVPSNGHTMRGEEIHPVSLAVFPFYVAAEHPVPVADGMKVFLLHPPPRLVWVSAAYPPPESMVDGIIDGGKGLLACHMSVIGRPSPNNRVELHYQVTGGRLRIHLNDSCYAGQV